MFEEPFKGLNPYSEADFELFFGRKKDTASIIANLEVRRLTILYGESGIGKSFVLRAGVAYQLRQQTAKNLKIFKTPRSVVIVFPPDSSLSDEKNESSDISLSWQDEPLTALKKQIEIDIKKSIPNIQSPNPDLTFVQTLRAWIDGVNGQLGCGELLIILDQFEQYFLHHPQKDEGSQFDIEFARAVNNSKLDVNFLISIREDAFGKLDCFKSLIPKLFDNILRLEHLDKPSARDAITQPIEQYNLQVAGEKSVDLDPDLVEAVLDGVAQFKPLVSNGRAGLEKLRFSLEKQIEAPYLQLVMVRLWEKSISESLNRCLNLDSLTDLASEEATGPEEYIQSAIRNIVQEHFAEAIDPLSDAEKELVASIFRYLVTPSGTKYAYSVSDLYRRYTEDQQKSVSYDKSEAISLITELLENLARGKHRIIRSVVQLPGQAARYEIFHDVLAQPILEWRRRYLDQTEQRSKSQKQALHFVGITALVTALVVGSMGVLGVLDRQKAVGVGEQRIESIDAAQQAQTGSQLAALMNVLQVAQTVQNQELEGARPDSTLALQKILTSIQERNRLQAVGEGFLTASQSRLSLSGNLAVTASLDGRVSIWNISENRKQADFRAAEGPIVKVMFLTNRAQLATAGLDGTATVWDLNGRPVSSFKAPENIGWIVGFSPNGDRLAASSTDGTLTVWSFQGERLATFPNAHDGWILNTDFSSEGQFLATAGGGIVKLWNISEQKLIHEYESEGAIFFVEFSADGEYLVTAGEEGRIARWSVETGQRIDTQNTQQGPIYFLGVRPEGRPTSAVSPESPTWATASSDGTVSLWDDQGNRLSSLRGHENVVQGISFSQDREITTITQNGTVRQWKLQQRAGFPAYETLLFRAQIKYSPNGQSLITSAEKGIKQWQLPDGIDQPAPINVTSEIGMGGRFDADGGLWFVATNQEGQTVVVQTLQQEEPTATYESTLGRFWYADLSPDLKWLATTSSDGTQGIAQIWDLQDPGQSPRELGHPAQNFMASVAFSPDGQRLATATLDGFVYLWDMAKLEQPLRSFQVGSSYATDLEFNVDGTQLVIALADNSVQLRDARDGLIQELKGHKAQVRSVHFSTDGQWLLTSSLDGTARLWDMQGNQWAEYPGRDNSGVLDAAFSPDGTQIATITLDGYVEVWPVEDFDQLVDRGCNWLDDFLKIHLEEQMALSEICPPQ